MIPPICFRSLVFPIDGKRENKLVEEVPIVEDEEEEHTLIGVGEVVVAQDFGHTMLRWEDLILWMLLVGYRLFLRNNGLHSLSS